MIFNYAITLAIFIPHLIGVESTIDVGNGKLVAPDSTKSELIQIDSNITSIHELINKFPKKAVLIEMWATWCPACLKSFNKYKEIKPFLDKNNIILLFISFDSDPMIWRSYIKSANLNGLHLRANAQFKKNLANFVWGAPNVYSLPNVIIFDKNHKIKDKTFLPPSDNLLFQEDLKRILEKN